MKQIIILAALLCVSLSMVTAAHAVVPPWEIDGLRNQQAPDFTIVDLAGKTISRKELSGKVVLLNFWATWCGPCAKEMPVFERVFKRFQEQGLVLVGISVDTDANFVKNFLKRVPVSFPIAVDSGSDIAVRYKVFTYPTTFLIDRTGKVQEFYLGERQWEEKEFIERLETLLK